MVVDAQGTKMEWDGVWDPRQFPERAPPNLASATAPTAAPVVVAPQLSAAAPSYTPPNAPLGQVSSFWPPPSAALGYGPLPAPPAYQPAPPAYPPLQGPWGTPPSQFVGPWGNNFGVSPTPPPMLGYTPYAYTPPTSYATPLFGNRIREDRYETDRYERTERDRAREESERKRYEEEIRRRDEEIRQKEAERVAAEHKAALERQQQTYTQEMISLREELRRMGEKGKSEEDGQLRREREERERIERERERERTDQRFQALQDTIARLADRPVEDPKYRTLEAELLRTREEHTRERERFERQQEMEKLRQETERLRQETQTALREATTSKPDPMVLIMQENARTAQENARLQAENMREISRAQQASADRMMQLTMSPTAVASLVKDSSQGTDMLLRNVVSTFSGMFDTLTGVVQKVSQLTAGDPGPSPVVQLAGEALSGVKELANKYLGVQRDKSINDTRMRAAQMQAEAHVRAAAFQAQAAASAAAPQNRNGSAATTRGAAPQSVPQSGLGGAQVATNPPAPTSPVKVVGPLPTDGGVQDPKTGQTVAPVIQIRSPGALSEEELFQIPQVLESVRHLRKGAATWLKSLAMDPPRMDPKNPKEPLGLSPSQAVDGILQGVNYLAVNHVEVPAFELFKQARYADFVDILLPNATQPYRDECVRILMEEVDMHTDTDENDEGVNDEGANDEGEPAEPA
mgnify:CR=1 FL=1